MLNFQRNKEAKQPHLRWQSSESLTILLHSLPNTSSRWRKINGMVSVDLEKFLKEEFCLQSLGDSPTQHYTFIGLIARCILILFSNNSTYQQYTWHLMMVKDSYEISNSRQREMMVSWMSLVQDACLPCTFHVLLPVGIVTELLLWKVYHHMWLGTQPLW